MNALIIRDDANLSISFTPEAEALKATALEASALVGRVTNPEERAVAVAAQALLNEIIRLAKRSHKEVKAAPLEYTRRIDSKTHGFIEEPESEAMRMAKMIGDYEMVLESQRLAAESLKQAEITKLEQERQIKLAEAPTHEAIDKIHEEHNAVVAALPIILAPERAKGQVVRSDWEIIITSDYELAKCHPRCVKITPLLLEIKNLLNMGGETAVAGVRAKRIQVSSTRSGKQPAAIVV